MEVDVPKIRGLRLVERADGVGSGEVWRARLTGGVAGERGESLPGDLAGVGECYVRLLRLPVDEAMREKARVVAEDVAALDDPGLVPIRAVQPAFDGLALVFGPLPAPLMPLPLLARRRQLSAGEIVTLGVGLAWALAAGHDAGFAHGRLRDADVLLDPGGRPLLAGVGVMAVLGASADPRDDVRALARMLNSLLDRESNGARRVMAALADPGHSVRALAARLAEATAAEPIALADSPGSIGVPNEAGEPSKRGARGRRRRPRVGGLFAGIFGGGARLPRGRAVRLGVAAAGVLALAGVIGWASAPGPKRVGIPADPGASSSGSTAAVSWAIVLGRLDDAWATAFERADTGLLDGVDVRGSSAFRQDLAQIQALRARGLHATGLRLDVERVDVRSSAADRVVLLVVDRRTAYDLRDSGEQVKERAAARGRATHLITLRNIAPPGRPQWRIDSVTDPAPAGS